MRRRNFITLLGGVASWSVASRAQQPAMPVVGFLHSASRKLYALQGPAFRQGLSETGYVEGHNLAIEFRWADDQNDRLPALVADLIRRQVTVICAANIPAAVAAKVATTTIPIVFRIGGDPVEIGLVASLNRPEGNLTGVTSLNVEIGPKLLEMMHATIPLTVPVALLVNPARPNAATELKELQSAAHTLGRQIHVLHARTERDLDTAFAALAQMKAGGVVMSIDALFLRQREQLAALALRHRMPAISPYREFAEAGGLMSYGGSLADTYRLVGVYVGRILMGEKPADLPVQRATKIELLLNLKTSKALGINVPLPLLARADEVIE
jgi:putative ABC transport system substrate-binding protein